MCPELAGLRGTTSSCSAPTKALQRQRTEIKLLHLKVLHPESRAIWGSCWSTSEVQCLSRPPQLMFANEVPLLQAGPLFLDAS